MKTAWLPVLSAAAMALTSLPAMAQMVVSAKSGVVNFTEGTVLLNDQAVESSITKYPEMKENAILRTEAGRAEVLLTPGTVMRVGENAGLKMISNRLIDTRIELQSGSTEVETVQTAKDNKVTVVVQKGAATLDKAGIYRFDTAPARIKVFHGEAAVEINGETTLVSSGRMMLLDGSSLAVEKFNAEDTDALDHWSKQRGQLLAMANPSTAKSLMSSGYGYGYGATGCSPYWGFNSWYSMYTYVPCRGYFRDPYGFSFWSPMTVGGLYYQPVYRSPFNNNSGGGFGASSPSYQSMGTNSAGYSSSMGSTASMGTSSMGSSVGSSGSTSAASGGGSVGHGGGASGGGGGGGGSHGH
jgi:hypothetical protein